jgi:hypothetical protein
MKAAPIFASLALPAPFLSFKLSGPVLEMIVLYRIFGSLLLIALTFAGLALMVAQARGQHILKNTAAFAGLFLTGIMLLQTCCSILQRISRVR